MFQRSPKAKEKYVSLDRAAEALCLSQSQLHQYLVTGQLLASIVYYKPSDYREQRKTTLQDGSSTIHTKTSRTMLSLVSSEHQFVSLMYLHPDDAARVLLNKVASREMLVSRLFRDRTLSPKQGLGLVGESSITVSPSDLLITSDELGRFSRDACIRIKEKSGSSIDLPQKPWYDRPIGRTGLAILGAVLSGIVVMWLKGEF